MNPTKLKLGGIISKIHKNRGHEYVIKSQKPKNDARITEAWSSKLNFQPRYQDAHINLINTILKKKRNRITISTKFMLDFSKEEELFTRYYRKSKCFKKLKDCGVFYRYHYEIPRLFMRDYLPIVDSFHDRRREFIYRLVCQKIGRDNIVGCDDDDKSNAGHKSYSDILDSVFLKETHVQKYKKRCRNPARRAFEKKQRRFVFDFGGRKAMRMKDFDLRDIITKNFEEYGAKGLVIKKNNDILMDITPIKIETTNDTDEEDLEFSARIRRRDRIGKDKQFKIRMKHRSKAMLSERSTAKSKMGKTVSNIFKGNTNRKYQGLTRGSIERFSSTNRFSHEPRIFKEPSIARTVKIKVPKRKVEALAKRRNVFKSQRGHTNSQSSNLKILNFKTDGNERSENLFRKKLSPLTKDNSDSISPQKQFSLKTNHDGRRRRRTQQTSKAYDFKRIKSQEFKISTISKKKLTRLPQQTSNIFKKSIKNIFNKNNDEIFNFNIPEIKQKSKYRRGTSNKNWGKKSKKNLSKFVF